MNTFETLVIVAKLVAALSGEPEICLTYDYDACREYVSGDYTVTLDANNAVIVGYGGDVDNDVMLVCNDAGACLPTAKDAPELGEVYTSIKATRRASVIGFDVAKNAYVLKGGGRAIIALNIMGAAQYKSPKTSALKYLVVGKLASVKNIPTITADNRRNTDNTDTRERAEAPTR